MTPKIRHIICIFMVINSLTGCWQSGKEVQRWSIHPEGATSFSLSRDGRFALIASEETDIVLWDLVTNQQLAELGAQDPDANPVVVSHISDNKRYAITTTAQNFAVWDLAWSQAQGLWSISEGIIRDAAISNNGEKLVLALSNGKALFIDLGTGRRLEFLAHRDKINTVSISPNGAYVLSGGNDHHAYFWNTQSGQIVNDFAYDRRVKQVALHREGKYAFVSDGGNRAVIWALPSGEKVSELDIFARQAIYVSARFSDDGTLLATGSPSQRVELWDVETGENIGRWQALAQPDTRPPSAVVYDVAIDPTGRVISGTSAGIAQAWLTDAQ